MPRGLLWGEVDAISVRMGPGNERGNAFTTSRTILRTEKQPRRLADPARGRARHVSNPNSCNHLGNPVAYVLHPEGNPILFADDDAPIRKRAMFATQDLWVTAYDRDELYSAGDFVNQHAGNAQGRRIIRNPSPHMSLPRRAPGG